MIYILINDYAWYLKDLLRTYRLPVVVRVRDFNPSDMNAPGHVFTTQGDSNPGPYADPREGAHARVRHGRQREFVIDIVVVVELRGCDIEPAVDERLRHVEEHRSRLRHVLRI